jgi:hypothetical protein
LSILTDEHLPFLFTQKICFGVCTLGGLVGVQLDSNC